MGDPRTRAEARRPVCFDLDGTLVVAGSGAAERLWCALDEVRAAVPGLSHPELAAIEQFLRGPLAAELAALLPDWPAEPLETAFRLWGQLDRDARRERGLSEAPGARALLAELASRGHRLSVATNAPQAAAERVLEALGMLQYLGEVRGLGLHGDADKAGRLQELFAEEPPGFGVMVGDGQGDGAAAARVGLRFAYYLGSGAEPEDCPGAEVRLTRLGLLPGWLETLPGCPQRLRELPGR